MIYDIIKVNDEKICVTVVDNSREIFYFTMVNYFNNDE